MMTLTCDDARQLVEAYVDGELELERALQLEAHAATCEACQRVITDARSLSDTLRAAQTFRAPETLTARIRALADQPSSHAGVSASGAAKSRRWSPWLAVAASIAVVSAALFGAQQYRATSADATTVRAVVDGHVRSLMAGHLTDVESSDRHTVKPWFAGRVDFAPVVVDLANEGDPLVGGRLDYISGHTAAALVYRRRNHTINVFIWPESAESAAHTARSDPRGYQVISWTRGGLTVWIVSDLALDELRDFAQKLDGAMQSSQPTLEP